jgi:hypothetical protein
MAQGREKAVERILAEMKKLNYDQLLRLVEKWGLQKWNRRSGSRLSGWYG